MTTRIIYALIFIILILSSACEENKDEKQPTTETSEADTTQTIYLHHSTGRVVWEGEAGKKSLLKKLGIGSEEHAIPGNLKEYNEKHNTNHQITAREFPAKSPYGWNNYPYDYYNIWVKHGDQDYYMEEPTLKVLTRQYDVVVFKHCFPVSAMSRGSSPGDPDSPVKSLANYKAQYELLKEKLQSYQETQFLLWTGPALVENHTNEEEALITREFYDWVINEWDDPQDNLFLWDFRQLETEGDLYLKPKYAAGPNNSHPSHEFGETAARLFVQRLTDVIEQEGSNTKLTGEKQ